MEKQQSTNDSGDVKRITDIALATYLTCDDSVNKLPSLKILRIERENRQKKPGVSWESKKSVFVFLVTPELDEKTLRFFNREAKVDPVQFFETFRTLKSYVRQG